MAERSARVRIEMVEPIGSMPSRLGTIRKTADLTRTATALAMQSVVAQTVTPRPERQREKAAAVWHPRMPIGGRDHPWLVVTVDGQDGELDLAALVR